MTIPIDFNVFDDRIAPITMSHNSIAYNNLFNESQSLKLNDHTDYTAVRISQKTEYFDIRIKLSVSNKLIHIKKGNIKNDLSNRCFVIVDASKEKMVNYANLLGKISPPILSNDESELRWRVNKPRVGYEYQLYFKLDGLETTAT